MFQERLKKEESINLREFLYPLLQGYDSIAMDVDLEGTDLVTLSACESGKGIIQPGEGAFGLARAFRTAGAKNILMTLWSVPDKETKELMSNFYKNLLKHQSKSEALRSAQLAERSIVKKRYGTDIPYFWAGFVLIGQ